jgi:hypothetical protein
MSWIAALAVIVLAGCAQDPEMFCGDDVGYYRGVDVEVRGGDPALSYDVQIEAEGTTLAVSSVPDAEPPRAEATLSAQRILSLSVSRWYETTAFMLLVSAWIAEPDGDAVGPASLVLTISSGGEEVFAADFTPTYDRNEPWGPECPGFEYARIMVDLPLR